MVNQWICTDNDNSLIIKKVWKLTPCYTFPAVVSPPPMGVNLSVLMEEFQPGGFSLTAPARVRTINQELHNQLLEQSLREHEDLWRRLAQE